MYGRRLAVVQQLHDPSDAKSRDAEKREMVSLDTILHYTGTLPYHKHRSFPVPSIRITSKPHFPFPFPLPLPFALVFSLRVFGVFAGVPAVLCCSAPGESGLRFDSLDLRRVDFCAWEGDLRECAGSVVFCWGEGAASTSMASCVALGV